MHYKATTVIVYGDVIKYSPKFSDQSRTMAFIMVILKIIRIQTTEHPYWTGNGHKPQTIHRPKRPQTGRATYRNCHTPAYIFTRGQYWPSGIVVACVCPSVRPSVTKFVRAITHHPSKLGSPNLDHRWPWLRSLLFLGVIDLDLQGQI